MARRSAIVQPPVGSKCSQEGSASLKIDQHSRALRARPSTTWMLVLPSTSRPPRSVKSSSSLLKEIKNEDAQDAKDEPKDEDEQTTKEEQKENEDAQDAKDEPKDEDEQKTKEEQKD